MKKKRVPVYGFTTDEKKFLLGLLSESKHYRFEENSPEASFTQLSSFSPHSILSLQIFILNLEDKRFNQPPDPVRPCLGCHFSRSVLLILHGDNPEVLENYELAYHDKDNIKIIYYPTIKDLSLETIHQGLNLLETNEDPLPTPTLF
jgi:hypothetical protein